jgi:NAD(P)-dependent dehydrogenase (short-subunit alcohol dehydrogenase family)
MNGQVVLVSGGAGNLGRAVSRAFLAAGAHVAVPFYGTDKASTLEELRAEFKEQVHTFALDLTTERGAEQAVREVRDWRGRLDVVVHLMGGYAGGVLLGDTPPELWDRMMTLNLRSAWLLSRYSIPAMLEQGGGAFVFVSSRAALQGRKGHGAYAVAKAGLLTLAATLAEEYGDRGVRANAILPGVIDTDANRAAMGESHASSWTSPDEIARVITFLASAESLPVNGAAIPVYGRS